MSLFYLQRSDLNFNSNCFFTYQYQYKHNNKPMKSEKQYVENCHNTSRAFWDL